MEVTLSREKHLDHMVRVVPLIVCGYIAQSMLLLSISREPLITISLSILGILITLMILGFVIYDLKHQVTFKDHEFVIRFSRNEKRIQYEEILSINITDPGENFSNLIIKTHKQTHTFYFIDDAEKMQSLIESKRYSYLKSA